MIRLALAAAALAVAVLATGNESWRFKNRS